MPLPPALRLAALLAGTAFAAFPAQTAQIAAESRQPAATAAAGLSPYAAVADRVLAAPAIIDATIRSATILKGADLAGVPPGRTRAYVIADVVALIRGTAGLSARIAYLADVPLDARGKPPKLKKARMLLFARDVPSRPGEVQLIAPDAQQPWTPALDALVRRIAREIVAPDAPPAITGIGNAFHVPGSLPGEGETQVFLTTADGRPVSLSILRRPGEEPRWAVALAEIVDEAARPPAPDTLLWYRLACGLPRALPDRALESMAVADANAARADYRFVLGSLGSCRR